MSPALKGYKGTILLKLLKQNVNLVTLEKGIFSDAALDFTFK